MERAAALWRLTERYLDRMAELAGDAFRSVGSLKLAADEAELDELTADYKALREDGFDLDWVADLGPRLASLYTAGLRHPTDAALQPARWVRRLAAEAAAAGGELVERSRIESLDELEAGQVVIATEATPTVSGSTTARITRGTGSITGSRPRTEGSCSAAGAMSSWTRSSRARKA